MQYFDKYDELINNFLKLTKKGDIIINMGAGDCHKLWSILTEKNILDK